MINLALIAKNIIYKLQNSATLTAVVPSANIKENNWQGTTFSYPAIRVELMNHAPMGNGIDRLKLSMITFSVKVYSEQDSSVEANRIIDIVNNILFNSQISGVDENNVEQFRMIRIDLQTAMPTVRLGQRLWKSETFFMTEMNELP